MRLRGIFPILITPFAEDGAIDERALRRTVRFCVECGVHGVVWPAVASEFYSLSDEERVRFTRTVVEAADSDLPVIVGVSGCSDRVAAWFTEQAVLAGASAVMALPPYVVKDDAAGLRRYFAAIVRAAAGRPVIIQNAGTPMGQALSPAALARLVNDVGDITHIKEETLPSGHAVSGILAETIPGLQGVFGGAGGRYLIEEHRRGACGAMPACEFSDVFVTIWEHLEHGRLAKARGVFERLLPSLVMQATLRMAFTKEWLRRRGVIESTGQRITAGIALDAMDRSEIDALLPAVASMFSVRLPSNEGREGRSVCD